MGDNYYFAKIGGFGEESDACYVVKDIQTATPEVNKTEAVLFNTAFWPGKMADIAPIEEEGGFEVIDDGVLNGKYLLGLSNDMTGFVVMSINNKTGLVDKYAYITNNIVNWGDNVLGLDEPEDFAFGTSKSGFGAAFTYIEDDNSQRIFMSANSARTTGDKACTTETYAAAGDPTCTRTSDCTAPLKYKGIPIRPAKSWGLFEVALPLKVPADCWNNGTDISSHKKCDDVEPLGSAENPGGSLSIVMLTNPTNNNDGLNCRRASIVITNQPTPSGGFTDDDDTDVWDASSCLTEEPTVGPTPAPTPTTTTTTADQPSTPAPSTEPTTSTTTTQIVTCEPKYDPTADCEAEADCTGDRTVDTDSKVDNWDCEVFHGSLVITGNSGNVPALTDLEGMYKLKKVCGTMTVQNLDMLSLEGLHNLELVTGPLRSANHLFELSTHRSICAQARSRSRTTRTRGLQVQNSTRTSSRRSTGCGA